MSNVYVRSTTTPAQPVTVSILVNGVEAGTVPENALFGETVDSFARQKGLTNYTVEYDHESVGPDADDATFAELEFDSINLVAKHTVGINVRSTN